MISLSPSQVVWRRAQKQAAERVAAEAGRAPASSRGKEEALAKDIYERTTQSDFKSTMRETWGGYPSRAQSYYLRVVVAPTFHSSDLRSMCLYSASASSRGLFIIFWTCETDVALCPSIVAGPMFQFRFFDS